MAGISFLGAASGLQLNDMISQLVSLEKIPIQRQQLNVDVYEYKKDALNSLRSNLVSLQSTIEKYTSTALDPPVSTSVSDENIYTATSQSYATPGNYLVNVTSTAKNHIVTGTKDLATIGLASETAAFSTNTGGIAFGGTYNFTVNGIALSIDGTDTLSSLRSKIQGAFDNAGATADGTAMILGSGTGQIISLSASDTGTANAVNIVDTDGKLAELGLSPGSTVQAASDANFTVNGEAYSRSTNSVSDALSGVTFNFKTTGSATLSIALDSNTVKEDLSSFVSQYNAFVDDVNALLSQERVNSPQTYAEAIQGAFNGDPDLIRMLNDIRLDITSVVSNTLGDPDFTATYSYSASVGIDSEEFVSGSISPYIKFESADFDAAFAANPEGVMAFMAEWSTRLDTKMSAYSDVSVVQTDTGVLDGLTKYLDDLIDDTEENILNMEERVTAYEDRLRAQFSAMESAIQSLKLQQGALGALGSGASSSGGGLGGPM